MASWNEFFWTNNNNYYNNNNNNPAPEWMTSGYGSVASQVIRYPAQPDHDDYYVPRDGRTCYSVDPRVITMELNVPICCEGCEERVLSRLIDIDGVQSVKCDQLKQKVTVSGTCSPAEVLAACKKLFKRSKWWSS